MHPPAGRGVGRYCTIFQYWFQIHLLDFRNNVFAQVKSKIISINILELAVIIINYIAACNAFGHHIRLFQPRIHIDSDNSSADGWCYKVLHWNMSIQCLTKILGTLSKSFDVGLDVIWLEVKSNFFTNALSRGPIAKTIKPKFKYLCPTNDGTCSCLQIPSLKKDNNQTLYPIFKSYFDDILSTIGDKYICGIDS